MIFRKVLTSVVGIAVVLACGIVPQRALQASQNRDAGSIVVDGKTFSSARNCKGENWKYDAKSHTLSLNGYDGMYIDLSQQENAVIELSGANKVVSNVEAPAIQVDGPLTIQGEGTLDLEVTACRSALYAKNGDLTIGSSVITVSSTGNVPGSGYLLMADGNVNISGTTLTIKDEIIGSGGAIGANGGDIMINGGTVLSVDSSAKALTSLHGCVHIEGAGTTATLTSQESAIYAASEVFIADGAVVSATSLKQEYTAIYCPEGAVEIHSVEMDIHSQAAAVAGKSIELDGGYVADPLGAEATEVSGMVTFTYENKVAGEVKIKTGAAPTPTPTPVPENTGFQITPRMVVGGGLIIVALVVIAVLIVGKIRSRDY